MNSLSTFAGAVFTEEESAAIEIVLTLASPFTIAAVLLLGVSVLMFANKTRLPRKLGKMRFFVAILSLLAAAGLVFSPNIIFALREAGERDEARQANISFFKDTNRNEDDLVFREVNFTNSGTPFLQERHINKDNRYFRLWQTPADTYEDLNESCKHIDPSFRDRKATYLQDESGELPREYCIEIGQGSNGNPIYALKRTFSATDDTSQAEFFADGYFTIIDGTMISLKGLTGVDALSDEQYIQIINEFTLIPSSETPRMIAEYKDVPRSILNLPLYISRL